MAYKILCVLCEKSDLVAVANAVRAKNGTTDSYKVNQLASAVENIGGGTTENKLAQIVDKSITTVTAKDLQGVTIIKTKAFQNCSSLTSITIPNGVTSIGHEAFSGCSSLTSITIPDSVTNIGYSAFSSCSSLTSITIPNGVTSIGEYAFYYCSSLTSITIPNGVTSIGPNTFYNCYNLTSITIGNSVRSIGDYAFEDCSKLTSITIPDSVKSIGEEALYIGSSTNKATITMTATTPPTIDSYTFSTYYLNKIIVPKGTGNTYKSATNWSALASYIQEAT